MSRLLDFFRRKRISYPPHVTVWLEEGGYVRSFYAFMRRTEDGNLLLEPLGISKYIPGVEMVAKQERRPEPQPEYEWVQDGSRKYLKMLPHSTERGLSNG